MSSTTGYNLIMIGIYFTVLISIGLIFKKKADKGSDSYILADRKAPKILVIGSLFATMVSSGTLVGYAGMGYSIGLGAYFNAGAGLATLIWVGYWFIPRLREAKITTIPELFQRYFGTPHRIVSFLLVFCRDLSTTAGTAVGMAAIFKYMFDVSDNVALLICVGITVFFTMTGGAWAVLVTDTIQGAFILLGSTLLIPLAIAKTGGWTAFKGLIPPGHLNLTNVGLTQIIGWGLVGALLTLGNQTVIQRGFTAASSQIAKKSFTLGGYISFFWYMVPFLLSLCAVALFPNIQPSNAYFDLSMIYGSYIGIFFIIVLLATCISTVSSCILTITSNITLDFYKPYFNPNVSNEKLVKIQRICTFFITLIAVSIAKAFPYIVELFLVGARIMGAGMSPVFVSIVFWKRARLAKYSTLSAMILGSTATIVGQIVQAKSAASAALGSTAFVWKLDPVIIGLPITLLVLIIGTFIETRHYTFTDKTATPISSAFNTQPD
ncbi:sodium:solute symporter family protein [Alkaliphilus peptidifermentans]|uniref:Na+/proline symporter n=1 Tax=Alkaliphilus peptidifermentans DSM 18978 TaxID=1120976 RepID=A0A1G5L1L1_9FIRM|nr:sodium:solute symporter family protein [Alkaliphilus peptidifermentans]SCZ06268.1 Na+/proline symporter [Alkaliphilus peptidifermentans DSM 18978]